MSDSNKKDKFMEICIKNIDTVLRIYKEHGENAAKTVRIIREKFPELEELREGQKPHGGDRTSVAALIAMYNTIVGRPEKNRFEGWTINFYRNKYYQLHKNINGRSYAIYVGKIWDEDKARELIKKKLDELKY